MAYLDQVYEFACKWIDKLNDPNVSYIDVVDHWMADDCRVLGFIMDCGNAFSEKYKGAFNNYDVLNSVIEDITDISLLGSAIYSKWRYFNHWAYSADEVLEPENIKWFLLVLERLKALSNKGNIRENESDLAR